MKRILVEIIKDKPLKINVHLYAKNLKGD